MMINSPLLLFSLPQTLVLIEVLLAVAAIGLMVYLSLGRRPPERQQMVLRIVGVLVLASLLLGGLQYLIR